MTGSVQIFSPDLAARISDLVRRHRGGCTGASSCTAEAHVDGCYADPDAVPGADATATRRLLQTALQRTHVTLEPGRWWRVIGPDGRLWCETSDEDEARGAMRPGDRLERLYEARITEWRAE